MIAITICKLLLSMLLGYYMNRKGILTAETCQKLSTLIVDYAMPLLILTSLGEIQITDQREILRFIAVGAVFYCLLPLLAILLTALTRIPRAERPVYRMFYVFSNNLFMGYPVAAALYGPGCIFHLNLFNLGFNLLYYTYGIRCASGGADQMKGREAVRHMVNAGMLASLLVMILFFCGLQIPAPVNEMCSYIGAICSPLSMLVIGAGIGNYSLKRVFSESRQLYFVALLRLAVMPAITWAVMTLLGFDGMLRGIAVVSMGTPAGAMISMGCTEYGIYTRQGTAGVAMTTVLSMLTLPVMLLLLR